MSSAASFGDAGVVFSILLDLVFPVFCVGCECPGIPLCDTCLAGMGPPTEHSPRPRPARLPLIAAAASYDAVARTALLAYKERGRRELARSLGPVLAETIWFVLRTTGSTAAMEIIPVPSRRAAARARGGDHVLRLARHASLVLRGYGVHAPVRPVLRVESSTRDSAGLTAGERARNMAGAMTARRYRSRAPVVVVDDLVTTGATLAEACRALRTVGIEAVAAATVAATQRWSEPGTGSGALAN